MPEPVLARAKELVDELSDADISVRSREIAGTERSAKKPVPRLDEVDLKQMSLFDTVKEDDIVKEIESMELSAMTPIDALNTLYRMQNSLKNRWK